jgi:hypothetical protein
MIYNVILCNIYNNVNNVKSVVKEGYSKALLRTGN